MRVWLQTVKSSHSRLELFSRQPRLRLSLSESRGGTLVLPACGLTEAPKIKGMYSYMSSHLGTVCKRERMYEILSKLYPVIDNFIRTMLGLFSPDNLHPLSVVSSTCQMQNAPWYFMIKMNRDHATCMYLFIVERWSRAQAASCEQ